MSEPPGKSDLDLVAAVRGGPICRLWSLCESEALPMPLEITAPSGFCKPRGPQITRIVVSLGFGQLSTGRKSPELWSTWTDTESPTQPSTPDVLASRLVSGAAEAQLGPWPFLPADLGHCVGPDPLSTPHPLSVLCSRILYCPSQNFMDPASGMSRNYVALGGPPRTVPVEDRP